ncbi:acyltransferase [Clostridium ragsdalei]|uniref:acyltransferase n=1 Tax=Clostridium ragsdalei TaxID=217158 RepID=UPI0009FCBE32|nr:acyltransferase [Clostridium ragsdalei]
MTGTVYFKGSAHIGNGTKLQVKGNLILGKNFAISANTKICCVKKIQFGDNVLIGYDCLFVDCDAHKIFNFKKEYINDNEEIIIGDRVWICTRCTILKGTNIGNDIVIAANSCIFKKIEANNAIIGGYPVKVLRKNITWQVMEDTI